MATNNATNNTPALPVTVANGGTSTTSFTQFALLLGNNTSAIGTTNVGTNGQVLIASTGSSPQFAALTSTLGSVVYTPGPAALALEIVDWVSAGTWTPAISFGGGTTGITYTTRTGAYRRVGNTVMIEASITLSNKGSSTGAVSIDTLPVAASTTDCILSAYFSVFTFTGQVFCRIPASGTSVVLESAVTTGAVTALTDTAFANNTQIVFSGCYLV